MTVDSLAPDSGYIVDANDMYLPSVKEYIERQICNLSQNCSRGAAAIKRHRKGDGCTKRQGDGDEDIDGEDEKHELQFQTFWRYWLKLF